jgi:hypothetical protein
MHDGLLGAWVAGRWLGECWCRLYQVVVSLGTDVTLTVLVEWRGYGYAQRRPKGKQMVPAPY